MALFGRNRDGQFELFGYQFGRKTNITNSNIETFAAPPNDDGASLIGYNNYYVNFDADTRNEALLINRYREVAQNSSFDRALNDIVNEAISFDDQTAPIKLDLNALDLPDSVATAMHREFDTIMQMLDFKHFGREIFKRWYIDGRMYYHKVIDTSAPEKGIVELRYIDPRKMKKVREVLLDSTEPTIVQGVPMFDKMYVEYYMFNEEGYIEQNAVSGIKIAADTIAYAHSGLQDPNTNAIISYIHKALRPFTLLRTMEDSVVVAKFTRAPQRRAFYVDVGNLNRIKADQYMQETMRQHRTKVNFDSKTGEFRSDRKVMSMLEDYWFPKRGSERSTEIDTLTGDNAFSDMTDVDYFRKSLYESLNVPISRLESNAMFNLGRSSEITRDEVAFQHFIDQVRARFSSLFTDMLRTQLVLKNVMSIEDFDAISYNIEYVYGRDSFYSELKNMEITRERLNLVSLTGYPMEGLFSKEYIRKNIMQLTDEEIKQMDSELEKEKPETDELFQRGDFAPEPKMGMTINNSKPPKPKKPKTPIE